MFEYEKNPNPTKDQHFLVDKDMLQLIYDSASIKENESIVEIGGGDGALTDYLVEGRNNITVIEKDPYYANVLRNKYKDYPNVTVIEGDALNYNFTNYDRIVANLPYTITEPFLINLASSGALNYNPNNIRGSKVKSITLVVSQNSTRKMVAPVQITEGKSRHINQEFGIMGAICKTFCDLDIITAIPSSSFFPEPAVTSFLITLTPKRQKTTVDRIMSELLTDTKGTSPSIKRIYQLMLSRGELYKISKHKDSLSSISTSFTSANIENKNIYELSHAQISQLVQDLIRNDISIKSRNVATRRMPRREESLTCYVGGNFSYDIDDYDEEEEERFTKIAKTKYEKKYDYMFDSLAYDALLNRGLEYLPLDELMTMLGKNIKSNGLVLSRKG